MSNEDKPRLPLSPGKRERLSRPSTQAGVIAAARLLLGAGESLAHPCYSHIFARDLPQHHRGRANALLDAGSKLGPATAAFLGGLLLVRLGWRMANITSLVFLAVAAGTIAAGWISDRYIALGVSPTRVRKAAVVIGLVLSSLVLPVAFVHSACASLIFLFIACVSFGAYTIILGPSFGRTVVAIGLLIILGSAGLTRSAEQWTRVLRTILRVLITLV